MLRTKFTELVGCAVPIQQIAGGPRIALAVANAGGLGTVSVVWTPEDAERDIVAARAQTDGALAANIIVSPNIEGYGDPADIPKCVIAVARHVRVVDFFYADPDPALVELAHRGGALASWQVGSVGEAEAAAAAGCDLIVAQGIEGGGHLRGHTGLLALLSEVLDRVRVPVVAAGGIGNGRAMAAALAAGAAGVRVGTRFLGATESWAHPEYVQALINADAGDTVYTDKFAVGWPHAPHRVLRSCLQAAEAFDGDVVGEFVEPDEPPTPIRRFQGNFMPYADHVQGRIGAMPLWAGESVSSIERVQPAAEIIQELSKEAEDLLARWAKA